VSRETTAPGADGQQYRVSRNLVMFTIPAVIIGLLGAMLVWEVVRDNLDAATRARWPWRLVLLDLQSVSNMLALSVGLAFARAQYARVVRPLITWTGRAERNTYGMRGTHVWVVNIANGCSHNARLEGVAYQVVEAGGDGSAGGGDGRWLAHDAVVLRLEELGLVLGRDFDLNTLGAGAMLGSMYAGRFSLGAVGTLEDVRMRVRVVDSVGDRHERVVRCLFAATAELRSAKTAGRHHP
jgi:hypothetical protein